MIWPASSKRLVENEKKVMNVVTMILQNSRYEKRVTQNEKSVILAVLQRKFEYCKKGRGRGLKYSSKGGQKPEDNREFFFLNNTLLWTFQKPLTSVLLNRQASHDF